MTMPNPVGSGMPDYSGSVPGNPGTVPAYPGIVPGNPYARHVAAGANLLLRPAKPSA